MAPSAPARPRVSRETRLLLTTIVVSLLALSALARLRFPERPVTPNLVPPVLTQLARSAGYDDLALSVSEVTPRVRAVLTSLTVDDSRRPAFRLQGDSAIALFPPSVPPPASAGAHEVLAHDRASGLTIVRVPPQEIVPPQAWSPRRIDAARYLIAGDVSPEGIVARPVFVGSLYSVHSPVWGGPIWMTPASTDLAPGTFVFNLEGTFIGMAVGIDRGLGIVPADQLIATATGLLQRGNTDPGWLGLEVQALTQPVARAVGATSGIVIAWVDPRGPAADALVPAEVVEAIDGQEATDLDDWQARIARLTAGDSIVLRVRGLGQASREVPLIAASWPAAGDALPLGLTMRTLPNTGVELLRVEPDSMAARAGLEAGDVITVIGAVRAPAAAQVSRVFGAAPVGTLIPIAVTRADVHRVLALEKR